MKPLSIYLLDGIFEMFCITHNSWNINFQSLQLIFHLNIGLRHLYRNVEACSECMFRRMKVELIFEMWTESLVRSNVCSLIGITLPFNLLYYYPCLGQHTVHRMRVWKWLKHATRHECLQFTTGETFWF